MNEENYVILEPSPCHLMPPNIQDDARTSHVILELKHFVILELVIFKHEKYYTFRLKKVEALKKKDSMQN